MTDFPGTTIEFAVGACIHTGHPAVSTCNFAEFSVVNYAAAVWPAANRGIYVPFCVDQAVTARQMFWENGAVSGTTDIGIYDSNSARLVSLGATTNAGTIQIANITDTVLTPGRYYMGMVASAATVQTYWSAVIPIPMLRCGGVTQQAIGAATLPATATFAAVASAYLPFMGISFQATL